MKLFAQSGMALVQAVIPLWLAAAQTHPKPGDAAPATAEASAPSLTSEEEGSLEAACKERLSVVALRGVRLADDEFLAFLCIVRGLPEAEFQKQIESFDIAGRVGANEILRRISTADLRLAGFGTVADRATGRYADVIIPKSDEEKFPSQTEFRIGSSPLSRISDNHSRRGHFEATQEALKLVTQRAVSTMSEDERAMLVPSGALPPQVHKLMADAAQDADYYEWNVPAAHAQTGCEEAAPKRAVVTACPAQEGKDCWQKRFAIWSGQQVKRALDACLQPKSDREAVGEAAYWLGYALHAVQDLAPHRGRTNCEHAYNAYKQSQNPDECDRNYRLAIDLSARFLKFAVSKLPPDCIKRFSRISGRDLDFRPRSWKKSILGAGWGVGWAWGILKYRVTLAGKYPTDEAPIRWFANEQSQVCSVEPTRCSDSAECMAVWRAFEQNAQAAWAGQVTDGENAQ
jgi:hypothetical protein